MAERRMFAKTIVLSDPFLEMPLTARCLYFTLGMFADDDGFVNAPKSIVKQCGASEDDMKILILKKFVLPFESGVVVIKHWRINNYLRNDRYKKTLYQNEKGMLTIDESGNYHLIGELGIPHMGIPSIGKDRLGNSEEHKDFNNSDNSNTKNNTNNNLNNQHLISFERFWSIYPKKSARKAAEKEWEALEVNEDLFNRMVEALAWQSKTENWTKDNGKYIPYPSTWLNDRRWEDEPPAEVTEASRPGVDRSCVNPKGRIVVDENGYERFVREEEADGIQT